MSFNLNTDLETRLDSAHRNEHSDIGLVERKYSPMAEKVLERSRIFTTVGL